MEDQVSPGTGLQITQRGHRGQIAATNMDSDIGEALARSRWDGVEQEIDEALMRATGRSSPLKAIGQIVEWAVEIAAKKNRESLGAIKYVIGLALDDQGKTEDNGKDGEGGNIAVIFSSMDSEDQKRLAEKVLEKINAD